MTKEKDYPRIKFSPETILEAEKLLKKGLKKDLNFYQILTVQLPQGDRWTHDSEVEFFADYRGEEISYAYLNKTYEYGKWSLKVTYRGHGTNIEISGPNRQIVEEAFGVFEKAKGSSTLRTLPEKVELPSIFIGHGRNKDWRDLKDHLTEKHSYEVETYEVGARAGHQIRDVIESMMDRSSFAILVMTGEDLTNDGEVMPRQNVIHELGLFQGKLGFSRAIALVEEGTKVPSNINGVTWISFPKGRIKETYGDVLATLKREFN